MKIPFSCFPGKVKKNPRESDMLIGTSRREGVISLLLLVVVLCGYQIYQFLKLVYDLLYPPQTKFGGYMYIGITLSVRSSMYLVSATPPKRLIGFL
jgi:hypothetical protein